MKVVVAFILICIASATCVAERAHAQSATLLIERPLKVGSQGVDVAALQTFLRQSGYFTYPEITAYYGPITAASVAALQSDHSLEPVGIVGPLTRRLLALLSSDTTPVPSIPVVVSQPVVSTPICSAPPGLSCIPGTAIIQPFIPIGYIPGYGGGGSSVVQDDTPVDTDAPIISALATSSLTSSGFTVTWSTDESSDSQLEYGTTSAYGSTVSSAAATTTHSLTLSGLVSNTTYHYRVKSTDANGNVAVSADATIATILPTYASIAGIGDSITVGVNASTASNRWLNRVQAAVAASTLLNAGISGTVLQNSPDASGSPRSSNGRDRYATAVLGANKKSAIFFAYGFNDARYVAASATFNVTNYLNDMREVMNGLMLGGYERSDVYLLTPFYITDTGLSTGSSGFSGQTRSGFEAYVSAVRTIATEFGTKYTDTYTYMRDHGGASLIDTDNIHPSDLGHEVIADAVVDTTTVLNTSTPLTGIVASVNEHDVTVQADAASSGSVSSYEFEIIDASEADAVVVASSSSATPSLTLASVVNGTYRIKARAQFTDGTATPWAFSADSVTVFAAEATPPVISSISVSTTTSSATITWLTDESADSQIDFGADTSYGTASSSVATSTSHSLTLTGLSSGTTYHFRVQSTDVWGNTATSSDQTFVTETTDTSFVSDTFTDVSGTALTSHTPDMGGAWTVQSGSNPSTAPAIDGSGGLYSRDNASIYYMDTVPTSADYYVEADFVFHSSLSNDNVGIAARMQDGANTLYFVRWSQAQGAWHLYRTVSGVSTVLGTYVDTFTSGTKHVRFTLTGSSLVVAIDGTNRISVTSGAITGAGKAGIRMAIIQSATTGVHIDNFRAGY